MYDEDSDLSTAAPHSSSTPSASAPTVPALQGFSPLEEMELEQPPQSNEAADTDYDMQIEEMELEEPPLSNEAAEADYEIQPSSAEAHGSSTPSAPAPVAAALLGFSPLEEMELEESPLSNEAAGADYDIQPSSAEAHSSSTPSAPACMVVALFGLLQIEEMELEEPPLSNEAAEADYDIQEVCSSEPEEPVTPICVCRRHTRRNLSLNTILEEDEQLSDFGTITDEEDDYTEEDSTFVETDYSWDNESTKSEIEYKRKKWLMNGYEGIEAWCVKSRRASI